MTTWMCPCGGSRSWSGAVPGAIGGFWTSSATLHTEEFLRVKLGIGRPHPEMPTEKYVLSHFPAEEAENVAQLIERAAQAVVTLLAGRAGRGPKSFPRRAGWNKARGKG